MNRRFVIEKSKDLPNWWVLTDTENLIVCKFENGKFNETQTFSFIEEDKIDVNQVAHIMTEIGDWVVRYHSSKAFQQAFVYEYDSEERLCLVHTKRPTWRITIDEYMAKEQFAKSLRKAAEFVAKL